MHYAVPVRRLAKSHITTACQREHCLLCELGFVVRMLEDARGINCQAANFCKTISALPQGASVSDICSSAHCSCFSISSRTNGFNRLWPGDRRR